MKVFQHTMSSGEQATWTCDKPLCFLLDERKDQEENKKGRKGKKKKDNNPTFKNFGSRVNVSKLKGTSKLIIGWRIRPGLLLENCNYLEVSTTCKYLQLQVL